MKKLVILMIIQSFSYHAFALTDAEFNECNYQPIPEIVEMTAAVTNPGYKSGFNLEDFEALTIATKGIKSEFFQKLSAMKNCKEAKTWLDKAFNDVFQAIAAE